MINRNRDGMFIDTRLLRDHASKLSRQKRLAVELYECVKNMKRLSDPSEAYKYNSILRDAERMVYYFTKMDSVFDQIEYEATRAIDKIATKIEDNTERTRRTNKKNFML